MELPLDAQGSGRRLDVDERVEQCCAVASVLHVLAWFVLVLQMQHLRGIHTLDGKPAHRTVRCTSGATASQRTGRLQWTPATLQCTQKSEQPLEAHRTVNSTCPVPQEDKAPTVVCARTLHMSAHFCQFGSEGLWQNPAKASFSVLEPLGHPKVAIGYEACLRLVLLLHPDLMIT
jgi:hypothetical protein